jgi:hypothetical protein
MHAKGQQPLEKGSPQLSRKPKQRGSPASKRGRSKADWIPVLTVMDRGENILEAILEDTTAEQIGLSVGGKVVRDKQMVQTSTPPNGNIAYGFYISGGVNKVERWQKNL